jgi:mycothiol S-conjugate amidase
MSKGAAARSGRAALRRYPATVARMEDQLRLLTVHAHPDDESSKGAGTVARYNAEGARGVLVCCTGGEEGDILNPAMDRPEVRERLFEVRMEELAAAAAIIGYAEVIQLGYRDSGMPGTPANEDPRCFAKAPLEEAVERLVTILRGERPHVIVTYPDDQQGYPHPDHLRVHDITIPAFEAAGDPDQFPDAGEPWQPLKLYYSMWSRARIVAIHEKLLELGKESPFDAAWFERPSQDHRITTRIDVTDWYQARIDALLAHATQVDPNSAFWFALPPDVARDVYPFEDYHLARSLVDADAPENDLFAGVRDLVEQSS